MSKTIALVRSKYPEYNDLDDHQLALAIVNKYPVYATQDDELRKEYITARDRERLLIERRQLQTEEAISEAPTTAQIYTEAAMKGPDLPRALVTSPVPVAMEKAGLLPKTTAGKLGDISENVVEGSLSPLGIASLPIAGAPLAGTYIRAGAAGALGALGAQQFLTAAERGTAGMAAGDWSEVIPAIAEGALGVGALAGGGALTVPAVNAELANLARLGRKQAPVPPLAPTPHIPTPPHTTERRAAVAGRLATAPDIEAGAVTLQKERPDIYVTPEGTVQRGPLGPIDQPPPIRIEEMSLPERLALDSEVEAQRIADQALADQLAPKLAPLSPDVVEGNLPPRPQMPSAEAQQIATQFEQRVRGVAEPFRLPEETISAPVVPAGGTMFRPATAFERPANPQLQGVEGLRQQELARRADAEREVPTVPPEEPPAAEGGITVPKEPTPPTAPAPEAAPARNIDAEIADKVAEIEAAKSLDARNALRRQLVELQKQKAATAPAAVTMAPVLETQKASIAERPVVPAEKQLLERAAREANTKAAATRANGRIGWMVGDTVFVAPKGSADIHATASFVTQHPEFQAAQGPQFRGVLSEEGVFEPLGERPKRVVEVARPVEAAPETPVAKPPVLSKGKKGKAAKTKPTEGQASQGMGIVHPSMLPLMNFFDRIGIGTRRGEPVPVELTTDTPFPKFAPWEQNRDIATRPNGFGRVPGLGFLFDPRALRLTPEEQIMHTHAFERQVGNGIALVEIEKIRGTINGVFDRKGSEITNIGLTREGQSRHISDVFEALEADPASYVLTPEQRAAFDQAIEIRDQIDTFLQENSLAPHPSGEIIDMDGGLLFDFDLVDVSDVKGAKKPYFPRPALKKEGVMQPSLPGVGGLLGSGKPFFEKSRAFDTEAMGAKHKITYEPGIEERLFTYAKSAYRAVAEKRAAEQLKKLGSKLGSKEREAALQARFAEDVASGEMRPENVQRYVNEGMWGEQAVQSRLLSGYVFPEQVARTLDKYASKDLPGILKGFDTVNNAARSLLLGFDLSFLTIQALPLMFHNPKAYAKVAGNAVKAIFHEDVLQPILSQPENLVAMRELAQLGQPLGTITDLQRGLATGQFLPSLAQRNNPLARFVGKTAIGFGRSFQVALDLTALELWKIYRQGAKPSELPNIAEQIGNMTFRGRLEEIGVSPGRAWTERALFNAPAYYRAALNMIASVTQGGVPGKIARRGLGVAIGGAMILFYGLAKATGLSDEEILRRFDPGSGDFLMVPVKLLGDKRRNLGLGGPVRSFARLAGEIKDAAINDPSKLASIEGDQNPITHWFRGKLGPLPSFAWNVIQQKDYLGNQVTIPSEIISKFPIPAQPAAQAAGAAFGVEARQSLPEGLMESFTSMLGINAYPESQRNALIRKRSIAAREKHGADYASLSLDKQLEIAHELSLDPELAIPKTFSEAQRMAESASKHAVERQKRIFKELPKALQERMKVLAVHPTGYDAKIKIGDIELVLTPQQTKLYERFIIEQYKEMLPAVLSEPDIISLSADRRQDIANTVMQAAKEIAKAKLFEAQGP